MQYTHLGRTGLMVSRLCLGTMNFGPETSEKESFAIMDKALDLGINFFDTANVYGLKLGEGVTEKIIGRWLAQGASRRKKIVLTTKVFAPMGHDPNDRGLSAYHIRRACEESLQRLQTDHIDVYFMHHIDRGKAQPLDRELWGVPEWDLYRPPHRKIETPFEEIWQAMDLLVKQGKVLYIGSSNIAGWNIAQACEKAAARNLLGPVCEQSLYNLSVRTVELEVIPACMEYGLGLMPWSPLAGGLLAGALEKYDTGRRSKLQNKIQANRDRLKKYELFCRELGEKPADVALAWLLKNPVVTAPVIGPRTMKQLTDSLRAFKIYLDDEALAKLNEIWPGPGGQAPESYAW